MSVLLKNLRNGALTLTLNRPDVRNACSAEMAFDLLDSLNQAAADPEVRAVVITGAGGSFCAGGDLRALGSADPRDPVAARLDSDPIMAQLEQRVHRIVTSGQITTLLHTMGKPTIAVVRGAAAGMGVALAAACDFRIVSDTAFFKTAFATIGVSGDLGCSYYLHRLIGPARAREIMMFSDRIQADAALQMGLVTKVVEDAQLDAESTAFIDRLAQGPTVAYRYIKKNLIAADAANLQAYLELEARNTYRCFETQDAKEAVQAFLDKRTPQFVGR
ncbi:enoyl-CoA hydratase [Sphingomonas sp. MG17]|uniref:Enoyl-CoA hydratase n=1 Tax=Sphingomonas tagetis TaxID=2949092 RepID=A0A9X2KKW5_9SPHN|nr:enoyl-CoA hydratase [Sphingomonas tagetis]MCP3730047.1 enoyl-CoA hydratase [Sphingomonas tagetis]